MDKLEKLVGLCKGEVSLTINEHRSVYDTIEEFFADPETSRGVSPELVAEMVKHDQVVCVHFYPTTPVGFYVVYHHDLDAALDRALELVAR